jgi:hypothetical protein
VWAVRAVKADRTAEADRREVARPRRATAAAPSISSTIVPTAPRPNTVHYKKDRDLRGKSRFIEKEKCFF